MTTPAPPQEAPYRHRCRVLYGDTDSGGVVYYAGYLRYFEAARTEFMRERVAAYREIAKGGLIMPVVECHARYKAPARYDDLLLVETSLCEVRDFSCRFDYRIVREEDGRILVLGYTVHTAVDARGKLQRFPVELLALLRKTSRKDLRGALKNSRLPCGARTPRHF